MAGSVACASCGKEYRWKPELAGKRAKCKCGGVVSFPSADPVGAAPPPPPPPPPRSDAPEGFEDFGVVDDAPPPPPPPPPIPGRRPAAVPAGAPATGGFKDSTGKGSGAGGGFRWNWKAALNVLFGLGVVGFGIFEFLSISQTEAAGDEVVFGRRNRWLRTVYAIGGKWAVLGFFVIVGICLVGGGVLRMMGKIGSSDSER